MFATTQQKKFMEEKMNKKYLSIIFLLWSFSFLLAHQEPPKTLKEKDNYEIAKSRIVNSEIKKITTWNYEIVDGNLTQKKEMISVQEYDLSGNIISIEEYKNDSLQRIVRYTYDDFDNLIYDIDYSPDNVILEKNIFQYDSEGRVISGQSYEKDVLTSNFKFIQAYDKKSITFVKLTNNDSIDYIIIYSYSDDYDLSDYLDASKYDTQNNLQLRAENKFNSLGQRSEKILRDTDLKELYRFLYEYDENGNWTKITKKNSDGVVDSYTTYSYDENGNVTEMKDYDSNDKLKRFIEYEFENRK